jgi:DNA-binding response OmpR family regulator
VKILVVDGDADMVEMLTSWLRTRGYQVKYAHSAERIRSEWVEQQPDLVIVDTGLKDVDVLGLCRDLRSTHDALILAVASRADADTQVRCLESGADAYLVKPFLPAQLLAHIRALSRRVRSTLVRNPSSILAVGPIRVDALRNEVSVYGKVSRLTPTESKVLHLLAVNANDVCALDQIVAHVWGYGDEADRTLIKAHVRHLREKVEPDPSRPRHIVTVAGSGYMLVRHPDQQPSVTTSAATPEADEPSSSDAQTAMRKSDHQQAPVTEWPAIPEHMWHPALESSGSTHDAGIYTAG